MQIAGHNDFDGELFKRGAHYRLYHHLGGQVKAQGTLFRVWAPNARAVSLIGDFNQWCSDAYPLSPAADGSGIWEGWVEGMGAGHLYKYHLIGADRQFVADKADPFALRTEQHPGTASLTATLDYSWGDGVWMQNRQEANALSAPISIYEVHLGSWRRGEEGNHFLNYREMAPLLAQHLHALSFTHIELMPVMEHPLYESWGYQLTGYFAPTSRYGTPQDLMYLIDYLHQQGIGVILDWVPAHFATDAHGLWRFDGTPLYEHPDMARGYHPVWQTGIFNYGRGEVQSFLISNALFWLDLYHIDMLRVDGVSSMVYLNHMEREALEAGNLSGENSDAVGFLRRFNEVVYGYHGDIHTIAEESDAWPQVSSPTYVGGLGFGIKWNMGWMHDVLFYLGRHPAQRPAHHDELVSLLSYAFNENYVLSLSHDEVCSGKNSLLKKMPGSNAEQFANLRLLLGFMFAHPGKKLLFMQGEFGQQREWNPQGGLDWHLLDNPAHQGIARWVGDCAHLYKSESACHRLDCAAEGFEWVDASDRENSVVSFVRWSGDRSKAVLVVCNFSAQSFNEYRIGVPFAGAWRELLNSNAAEYGGWGEGNGGMVMSQAQPFHGHAQSLPLRLPQLTMLFFRPGEA